jgi:hypothetical protein
VFCAAFISLLFGFVIFFGQKEIGEKVAPKILVTLATGGDDLALTLLLQVESIYKHQIG